MKNFQQLSLNFKRFTLKMFNFDSKLTKEDINTIFDWFDTDGSNSLSREEVKNAIQQLGVKIHIDHLNELIDKMD